MRFVAGPLCDKFGPRLVFIGLLLCGSIPTAMAGLVTTPNGLIALRFFVGILGGTFVPCQVWCTGFFDKKIVGTANALAGGWGNAGGGITLYVEHCTSLGHWLTCLSFVMPAVYDSLVKVQGLPPHKAWRVAYIVPFIIIVGVALTMLFVCEDTPTGKWSERHLWVKEATESEGNIIDINSGIPSKAPSVSDMMADVEKKGGAQTPMSLGAESQQIGQFDALRTDTVVAPTRKEALNVLFSMFTAAVAIPYACTFGAELAIESVLANYYVANFPSMGQTESGRWAAMFGLLNIICRPAGGFVADFLYRTTQSLWSKKILLVSLGLITGAFQLAIGLTNPKTEATMFGLMAGLAFFLEACNGAIFSLVPHVYPFANGELTLNPRLNDFVLIIIGVVSGAVGGMGNFGGIIFAIIFRYNGSHYAQSLWIIGAISLAANVGISWIRPVAKNPVVRQ